MNILMLSKQGDGMGIAHQLVKEGHSVKVWIKDNSYENTGLGLVDRIGSFRPHITGADLIVGDVVGFGRFRHLFDRAAKPVIGVDPFADAVELDRTRGVELFRRAGVKMPKTWAFSCRDACIGGNWPQQEVVLRGYKSCICPDKDTTAYVLENFKEYEPFVVQKCIEGIEVSVGGWFNGRSWITPFNHTFEERRLFEGGLGPTTGCMGTVVVAAPDDSQLVKSTLQRLTRTLKKAAYMGPVTVRCVVNEGGIYALGLNMSFGYDSIEAIMEGLREPTLDLLFETSRGVKKEMALTHDYLIAVRLSVPPWPFRGSNGDVPGKPILGVGRENLSHLFLTDVYRDNGKYKVAMGDGIVLKATARGRSVREAQRRVYRTLDNIQVQDKQYRLDIGSRVDKDIAQLKEWGYCG